MDLYNQLRLIYNNEHLELAKGTAVIVEKQRDATVNHVTLHSSEEMLIIKEDMLSTTNGLFVKKSPDMELSHGCDGVAITGNRIFLIEIKSTYSWSQIEKARLQLIVSYIKLSHLFSLIEGQNVSNYKVSAIIVSESITDETKTKFKKQIDQAEAANKYSFAKFCMKLNQSKQLCVEKKDTAIPNLPINNDHTFNSLPFYHVNATGNCATVDLNQYKL